MMKGQKGITLVALVITIIVMLILVAVTITVAMNGGLFDTARGARDNTLTAKNQEEKLRDGYVNEGGATQWDIVNYATYGNKATPATN